MISQRQVITFILLNFIVSAVSDIVLNDLSHHATFAKTPDSIIGSLRTYFDNRTIIGSAVLAGLTVVAALIATILLAPVFGLPSILTDWSHAPLYLVFAYGIGYIFDWAIDRWNVFGDDLKEYYRLAGAGHWGAIAFVFSLLISFILQKYLIPLL